eukprot:3978928-Pyramimonas_sp.AAC.1
MAPGSAPEAPQGSPPEPQKRFTSTFEGSPGKLSGVVCTSYSSSASMLEEPRRGRASTSKSYSASMS